MSEISFPAHTQARMDAAKAAKAAKTSTPADPDASVTTDTQQEPQTPRLPGYIDGLGSDSRRAILESPDRVAIAYGTLENPLILIEKVNVAMLRHCKFHLSHASPLRTSRVLVPHSITNIYQTFPTSSMITT